MSHLTTVKSQFKDIPLLREVVARKGFSMEKMDCFTNRFSGQTVENAWVVKDGSTPKIVVDSAGNAHVDPYYMGWDHQGIFQDYAAAYITRQAEEMGKAYEVRREGNDLVVEVTY